ncbi:RNA 2',3'-cyclic phosphodiesterase [Alkalilimnicola ehrlichii]|nr:RNA 2',3'-cyclic phosphodiesterase [Alkalilimnicola ehrlichii]
MEEDKVEEKWRLFFALWPDERAQERAALEAQSVGGRRVQPQNLHVTLLFLGGVDAERVTEIEAQMAAVETDSFDICLSRREVTRRGIAWLAVREIPAPLRELYRQVVAGCEALGIELEQRPFRPHLTLARRARPHRPVMIEPIEWRVRRFSLVRSQSDPSGVQYHTLREWPLREAVGDSLAAVRS